MAKKKVGVVIYTYDRADDAKINMEIIRSTWATQKLLKDVPIVHVFNGNKEWWPEKYLENDLVIVENTGHFSGCALQIDAGICHFKDNYPEITHVVVLAADTWILEPAYLTNVIKEMSREDMFLASCGWVMPVQTSAYWRNAAVDYFVIDLKFANSYGFFPLAFDQIEQKYGEIFALQSFTILVESVLVLRFRQALLRYVGEPKPSESLIDSIVREHIYLMKEREPVHLYKPIFERKMYHPEIGLLGHHDPIPKQEILKNYDSTGFGPNAMRFLESTDLSYFNKGITTAFYQKKHKKHILK